MFDLLVILFDWLLLMSTSSLSGVVGLLRSSKVLRLGRIFRTLRIARLIRLMKMPSLLDDVADYVQTDALLTFVRVARSLVTLAVANHFLACGWYAVGRASTPSWITRLDDEGRDLAFRYVTALHWSLTQFTPASMEIYPKGFPERVYSICVLFLALVVFSSFVSSITNAMNHLRHINEATQKQNNNLRRYINENKLSLELGNRIRAFAKRLRVRTRFRVHQEDIDVFRVLPEPLRLQVYWEVYVPILSAHPFFGLCSEHFETFVLRFCFGALHEQSAITGQELFNHDQEAKHMLFVMSGTLEYCQGLTDIQIDAVNAEEWCSEVAIWLKWAHEGRLSAMSHSELVLLDANVFRKFVSQASLVLFEICKVYAMSFQEHALNPGNDVSLDIFCGHASALERTQNAFASVNLEQEQERELDSKALGSVKSFLGSLWRSGTMISTVSGRSARKHWF